MGCFNQVHRMHRTPFKARACGLFCRCTCRSAALLVALGTCAWGAGAQTTPAAPLSLRQAYEAAWAQQPDAAGLAARRDATRATQQAAQSWTPEPVALELGAKGDRLNRNLGTREYEAGVAITLWLPGERRSSQALALAEGRALDSKLGAAQLRVAAAVREAWWAWQRARADVGTAQGQLGSAQQLASDVAKRLKAGDLARADQHQADGAVAAAQAALAQAQASSAVARQQLRTLTAASDTTLEQWAAVDGASAELEPAPEPEPEPAPEPASASPTSPSRNPALDTHAELLALQDRSTVAASTVALAASQTRANPELTLGTTRDRSSFGSAWQQTLRVGVRIPLGAGPRHTARLANAQAEAAELQAQLNLERARLAGERHAAQARTAAARVQLAAADRRAQLARETRGFFDKSFRLGETDLPTRLRIEAEAAEADRQAARARIELAAAISAWRQALGGLPL
jgi:outer membrane protein, heavy metal efflux system